MHEPLWWNSTKEKHYFHSRKIYTISSLKFTYFLKYNVHVFVAIRKTLSGKLKKLEAKCILSSPQPG